MFGVGGVVLVGGGCRLVGYGTIGLDGSFVPCARAHDIEPPTNTSAVATKLILEPIAILNACAISQSRSY